MRIELYGSWVCRLSAARAVTAAVHCAESSSSSASENLIFLLRFFFFLFPLFRYLSAWGRSVSHPRISRDQRQAVDRHPQHSATPHAYEGGLFSLCVSFFLFAIRSRTDRLLSGFAILFSYLYPYLFPFFPLAFDCFWFPSHPLFSLVRTLRGSVCV